MEYHRVTKQITDLLTERGLWFQTFEHEPVRTSEEAAKVRTGYTIDQGAKALIVRAKKDGTKFFAMIVVSGGGKFDATKLKSVFGLGDVRFATEEEVAKITEGVLPGGVPPFGNLFSLPVYADRKVVDKEKIIFNAGDRRYSVGMYAKDYLELVKPNVGDILL